MGPSVMAVLALQLLTLPAAAPAPPASPRAVGSRAIVAEFAARLHGYHEMVEQIGRKFCPLRRSAGVTEVQERERVLAAGIKGVRAGAVRGEVFNPAVEMLIRGILREELRGVDGAGQRAAIADDNPSALELAVNREYPDSAPLSTVPASFLGRLPALPEGVEYRFVGRSLILRDVRANLIVDYIKDCLP